MSTKNNGDTSPNHNDLMLVARVNQERARKAEHRADDSDANARRLNTANFALKTVLAISVAFNSALGFLLMNSKPTHDARSPLPSHSTSSSEPGRLSNGEKSTLSEEYDRDVVEMIEALATLLKRTSISSLEKEKIPSLYIQKSQLESLRLDHEAAIKTLTEALDSLKHRLFSNDEFELRFRRAEQLFRLLEQCAPQDLASRELHANAAISDLTTCLNLSPENISTYIDLGKIYHEMGKFREAQNAFNTAESLLNKPSQQHNPDRKRLESELWYEMDRLRQKFEEGWID